jgi:hypothetical protein
MPALSHLADLAAHPSPPPRPKTIAFRTCYLPLCRGDLYAALLLSYLRELCKNPQTIFVEKVVGTWRKKWAREFKDRPIYQRFIDKPFVEYADDMGLSMAKLCTAVRFLAMEGLIQIYPAAPVPLTADTLLIPDRPVINASIAGMFGPLPRKTREELLKELEGGSK